MSRKPKSGETSLVGSWVVKDGSMGQDAVCERIQWLIDSCFEQIAVDGDNWSALYRNPDDRSYWELTYPNSHMHGGGPPVLQRISEDDACKRYKAVRLNPQGIKEGPQDNVHFVIEGNIVDTTGITTRSALPLEGNIGGLDEVLIPNAMSQMRITNVSSVNPRF